MTNTEAIEALERRIDFLARKVADDTSGRPLHRERQEIGALRIAILHITRQQTPHLEECPCPNP